MVETSKSWIRRQLKSFDWSLIKGSSLVSIGNAIARLLGLAFSLLLAGAFPVEDYGQIRYALAVASIVTIGTMPIGQHVISRFVSKYRNDAEDLDSILSNCFFILLVIALVTILIATPVLMLMGKFSIGIMIIFLGQTLFYAYWGLSSGFLEARRLTAAYLGTNVLQVFFVFILIQSLHIHSTLLALTIYGVSHILPLIPLTIFWPLPGHIRFRLIDRKKINEVVNFSVPILISHACFTYSLSFDLLVLERWVTEAQLGAYSLSKTLATMFIIVPSGISTLLMPKVASSPRAEHRSMLAKMLVIALVVNAAILLVYVPLVGPLTGRIFGNDYLVPLDISLLLSLYMILYGIHGLVAAVFVGSGRPKIDSSSRVAELVATLVSCWILVPTYGTWGAAIGMLIGKSIALATYGVMYFIRRTKPSGVIANYFFNSGH
jgi:O-antigen/teichoic acid export membrane protein